jgi:hypothetical protein
VAGTSQTQANAYDRFSRLVSCLIEDRDQTGAATTLRGDDWGLDLLGNWSSRAMG